MIRLVPRDFAEGLVILLLLGTVLGGLGASCCESPSGPPDFKAGDMVRVRITGARGQVVRVFYHEYESPCRWIYRVRVSVHTERYPGGVVANPSELTMAYPIVEFRDYELEPWPRKEAKR